MKEAGTWSSHVEGYSARWSLALVVCFVAAWAVLEDVLGSRLQGNYDLMQVVWCRYAVHVGILFLLFGWRKPSLLWSTRRPVFQLLRSLMMFIMPYSFAVAVYSGAAVETVWSIFWAAPILALVLARAALRERVPPVVWLLAALSTVAALVILRPPLPAAASGWIAPLLMALSFAVYVVMTRSLRFEPLKANLFFTALGVLLVLSPLMPWVWSPVSAHDALIFIGIGAVGLLALLALDRGFAGAPVSVSAPALPVQLVFVLLLGHGNLTGSLGSLTSLAAVGLVALTGYLLLKAGSIAERAGRHSRVAIPAGVLPTAGPAITTSAGSLTGRTE